MTAVRARGSNEESIAIVLEYLSHLNRLFLDLERGTRSLVLQIIWISQYQISPPAQQQVTTEHYDESLDKYQSQFAMPRA